MFLPIGIRYLYKNIYDHYNHNDNDIEYLDPRNIIID